MTDPSLALRFARALPALLDLVGIGGLTPYTDEQARDAVAAAMSAGATAKNNGFGVEVDDALNRIALVIVDQVLARAALGITLGILPGNVPVIQSNSKLSPDIMPSVSVGERFDVASQAAMLALTAQFGDVAHRTDQGVLYWLLGNNPATLGNWVAINDPSGGVLSVAGLTGSPSAAQLVNAIEATVAQMRAATADKAVSADIAWAAAETVALVDAGTVAVDMAAGWNFTLAIGGNRTLGNPTNAKPGQSGFIEVTQDGTGSRTLAFGANWKNTSGKALSTAAGAKDSLYYVVKAANRIEITGLNKNIG